MYILRSVGVMSIAKIIGLLYGCMGLLFVPLFLLFGLLGSLAGEQKTPFAGLIGIALAVMMPLMYGVMGFVVGALGAWLYNLLSNWVGGFELELNLQPSGLVAPYPIVPPPTPAIESRPGEPL
jgi:hypothetical protein